MNKDKMPSFVGSLWKSERLFVSFAESIYSSITNNAISMYKDYLINRYPNSYSKLDSNHPDVKSIQIELNELKAESLKYIWCGVTSAEIVS